MATPLNITQERSPTRLLKQFSKTKLKIQNYLPDIVMTTVINSICRTHHRHSIGKHKPIFLDELIKHIDKYIAQKKLKMVLKIVTHKTQKNPWIKKEGMKKVIKPAKMVLG